jgi:hypothetical protein
MAALASKSFDDGESFLGEQRSDAGTDLADVPLADARLALSKVLVPTGLGHSRLPDDGTVAGAHEAFAASATSGATMARINTRCPEPFARRF